MSGLVLLDVELRSDIAAHLPVYTAKFCTLTYVVSDVGPLSVVGTATTVSTPACDEVRRVGAVRAGVAEGAVRLGPSSTPQTKKVRFDTIGPPRLAFTRLKPRLTLLPNELVGLVADAAGELLPPVRVAIVMMPDCALPNSADEAPVVTEASSKPLVPTP